MTNAVLSQDQAKLVPSKYKGITSGKRCKETGKRPTIYFCSISVFLKYVGFEYETIEI